MVSTESHFTNTQFLTILRFKVGEAKFRAFGGDKYLSVEGEDHGFVLHVDHTANHIATVPGAPEQTAAQIQTVALCTCQEDRMKMCKNDLLKASFKKKRKLQHCTQ